MLFLDVDDFKGVNDRLGHERGDRLLSAIAKVLSEAIRDGDIVGRWGGDEFLVVPFRLGTSVAAVALANRILRWFENELDLGEGLLHRARLTIGIGWCNNSNTDLHGLVRAADEALYAAKVSGKGVARLVTI